MLEAKYLYKLRTFNHQRGRKKYKIICNIGQGAGARSPRQSTMRPLNNIDARATHIYVE